MKSKGDEHDRNKVLAEIKFVVDKLPEGFAFPCTTGEIKNALRKIPVEHLVGIRRIKLSAQKMVNADASYIDGTINIYAVPRDLKFVFADRPPDSMLREYSRFGARWEVLGNQWYCYWRPENFKKYILEHVLYHELGHHIDDHLSLRRSFGKEKFAELYALDLENKLKNGRNG